MVLRKINYRACTACFCCRLNLGKNSNCPVGHGKNWCIAHSPHRGTLIPNLAGKEALRNAVESLELLEELEETEEALETPLAATRRFKGAPLITAASTVLML